MINNQMINKISIIIPVLNEADFIGKLLEHLLANSLAKNLAEIIVVDGGSSDATPDIVQAFLDFNTLDNKEAFHYTKTNVLENALLASEENQTKIILFNSEKGRAKQMNLGAKLATGNILYFLHADSFPPPNFDQLIIDEVKKGKQAGCFRMQFDSNHLWLKMASWFTKFNWKACRGGDQSTFTTASIFNKIGGFNEAFVIYEDNDFISKLYACSSFSVIQERLTTSARRYKSYGIFKLQYHFWAIHLKKWLGATPENLNQYYKKHVNVKN
jgi:rSAM/selenodomain-associated transferase 2